MTEPKRTLATYRRDLLLARQVVAQLREQALEADEPFHAGDLALDAAALDALWKGWTILTPASGMKKAWNGSGAMPIQRVVRHAVGGEWGTELG